MLFVGDTDTRSAQDEAAPDDEFDCAPCTVFKDMLSGGVNLPWNLALVGVIGLLSIRPGPISASYGGWNRFIV